MKALVKLEKGFGKIEVCEVPEPLCGDGKVKIEVKAVGLCGSDIHIMHDALPYTPPVILGHEFCGMVAEVGTKVTNFKVGDRVVAENVSLAVENAWEKVNQNQRINNDKGTERCRYLFE